MIKIDYKYVVNDEQLYTKTVSSKSRIILTDTGRVSFDHHINSFPILRRIPHFTLNRDGKVFEHININYYADYYSDHNSLNKESIIISLMNASALRPKTDVGFINWAGDTINETEVFEFKWKDFRYWHTYTPKQIKAVTKLINHLCDIIPEIKPTNIFGNGIYDPRAIFHKGVVSESNIFQTSHSINPSFDWKKIS